MLLVLLLTLLCDLVGKENRCLDLSFSSASRTGLFYLHFHCRANALTCDLHEAELTERQHIVLGSVAVHEGTYVLVELLLMVLVIHVDKIDDDDAAYIAQTQLVYQLLCCQHVKLEGILLLVLVDLLAAGIDINGVRKLKELMVN